MANAVGVALETHVVRAVSRVRGKLTVAEFPWDSTNPEPAVDALRAQFGGASAVGVSVGLGFLEVARPELPPLPAADARRVLLRDADRYFPLEGETAVSLGSAGGVAFALKSAQLQRWTSALAQWAPVHAVVAAPDAVAAAIRSNSANAVQYSIEAADNERGLVRVQNGLVTEARRVAAVVASASASDARAIGDDVFGVSGNFAAAIGALASIEASTQHMLLDAILERALNSVRSRRAWRSYALLSAGLVALLAAFNVSRNRTLVATQTYADSLEKVSAPGVAAAARLARAVQEMQTLKASASRTNDALQVLATVSKALPLDAFVQRIEWDGVEWRLEGSTDQAASIVQKLDAQALFTGVRVLNASMRFRDGNRTRESFSVAFRTKGTTNVTR